jgi:hypothetical protein
VKSVGLDDKIGSEILAVECCYTADFSLWIAESTTVETKYSCSVSYEMGDLGTAAGNASFNQVGHNLDLDNLSRL